MILLAGIAGHLRTNAQPASPGEITVKGKVTGADNAPLSGVSVVVRENLAKGTTTNAQGNYSISVQAGQTLDFKFMGYINQSVKPTAENVVNITLKEDVTKIEDVMVIGYGTTKKETLTGAVSAITTTDLLKSPVPNIGNMLVGQVTGLSSIQTTGLPGADDPEIYVRGIGTLNPTSSQPLMLVDGVERSFFQLDPNEIESISVLKDAWATAVFGVQGANGVIIVTTRRGTEGKPKISVSLTGGLQMPLRLMDFVDSYNFCVAYNEYKGDIFPDALMEKYRTHTDPLLYPSHNWIKELMKPYAPQTQDNINVSGGNSYIKYFASLGYFSQDGMFKQFNNNFTQNYTYNRFNYRTNFDINATKSTKFSVSIGGVSGARTEPRNTESGANNQTGTFRNIYWGLPFSAAGIIDGKQVDANQQYVTSNVDNMRSPFFSWYGKGTAYTYTGDMNLDLALDQKLDMIIQGLSASVKYSYNNNYTKVKNRTYNVPVYTPWAIGNTPDWQNVDPTADPNEVILVTNGDEALWGYGEPDDQAKKNRKYYWEGALKYDNKFGKHQVTGLFLGNAKKTFYLDPKRYNYPEIPLGSLGFVWRATYNYAQKYLFEFNAGYNGSENFAPGKRFGFFPSVSGGWVISSEQFMKQVSFISFLKLRASWGKVGSDYVGLNRFLYLPDLWNPSDGVYYYGNSLTSSQVVKNGAHETKIGNPDVTWETAVKQNYGIDLTMLSDRLSLNADLFFEKRRDILAKRNTIPVYVAVELPFANIGKVDNHGYEISVKWKDKLGRDSRNSYWVGGNVSYSKNKIVYQDEIPQNYPWQQATGHRVGQNFGYVFEGLYHPADFPAALQYNPKLQPGDAKYGDLNSDGQINNDDVSAIGYSKYPDYTFSFNAGLSFKGFDFSMLWQGATHVSKDISSLYRTPFGTSGNRNLMLYPLERRYVSETLTPNATYPRFSNDTRTWNYDTGVTNSFWVRDASYLRLKNIELGYTVTAALLKKVGISNFRVFINGSNLLTFDNLIFIDPEESANSTEYPNMAIVNMGLNFNF